MKIKTKINENENENENKKYDLKKKQFNLVTYF